MSRYLILPFFLAVLGCSLANPPRTYTQVMNSWLGIPITALVESWGEPAYKFNLTDGRQQYHWDRLAAAVSPAPPDYGPGGRVASSEPSLVTSGECGITVTIDPYHKVSGYSQPKPGCEKMGLPRSWEESQ